MMTKQFLIIALGLFASNILIAQELPKPSPLAITQQRIGITDISIEYSRPSVRARKIWGELVPFDEVWRAGANAATLFKTSTRISLNGTQLPAGKYAFLILPGENGSWTAIFNSDTNLRGTSKYNKDLDVLRLGMKDLEGKLNTTDPTWTEMLEYRFLDVDYQSGYLVMDWADTRIGFRVETDVMTIAMDNLNSDMRDSPEEEHWKILQNLASFSNEVGEYDQGIDLIGRSLDLKNDEGKSHIIKADLLKNNGMTKEAKQSAKTGLKMLEKSQDSSDQDEIQRVKQEYELK